MNIKERAAQAKIILDNEVFQSVLLQVEDNLVHEWKISDNREHRESCWLRIDALRSIVEELEAVIQSDMIEEKTKSR